MIFGVRLFSLSCWFIVSILLVLFRSEHSAYGDELDWDLKSSQDDVTIFQRQFPNSGLLEIKGQIRINASLATVLSVIGGNDHWTEWMPRTIKAEVIKKHNQGFIFYTQFKGFGPIWNREVYLFMSAHCEQIPESSYPKRRIEVRFTTEDPELRQFFETDESVIRIPTMIGAWYLSSAELPTKTYVEYRAYVDAGGQLTDFLKNLAARMLVKQALRNLQKQVLKYPEPNFSKIQEDAPSLFPRCLKLPPKFKNSN